ncbi:MAG: ABC transporter substrate-binding protein [Nitrososphaerales archaeon]
MKISHTGIANATAVLLIIVILVIGAGATYYYTSSTIHPTTVTATSSTTSSSSSTTSTSSLNVDPHPTQLVEDTFGGGPQYVDPAVDYETAGSNVIQNVNEQLLFFKGSDATTVVPWLAKNYTVSADGKTYTFNLRQGIKFSDGTQFNASAVYFSIMRAIIIDDPSGPAWAVDQILRGAYNYSASYGGANDNYSQAGVDALIAAAPVTIDGLYTVSFHLLKAYAAFPFIMAFSITAITDPSALIKNWVSPTSSSTGTLPANAGGDGLPRGGVTAGDYSDAANQWQATHTVGTGPYELQTWDQTTGDVTLVANPNYWGGPDGTIHPTIQTILIKQVNDANTRELDFKAGTSDINTIPIATGQIFDFINQTAWTTSHTIQSIFPGVSIKGTFPELETDFMGMDQHREDSSGNVLAFQPFQDPKVREAMAMLFDDATYINEVEKGFSPTAFQIIPPGMFGFSSSLAATPFNTTTAKALLVAAGPSDGFGPNNPQTINIYYNTGSTARQDAAIILASNINSIATATGLFANIVTLPWPQYLAAVEHHHADVWSLGWIVDYVDPDDFLVPFVSGTAGTYAIWSGFDNATLDSWVTQQAATLNTATRLTIINNIQTAVNNQHLYIWTLNGVDLNEARTWIQQKPNAYITSNIGGTYLTSLYGYYYSSIEPLT